MTDAEFLRAFDAGALPAQELGHRGHLRLAYILITRHGRRRGEHEVARRLRHVAEAHGTPERYHHTLTAFWARLLAHVVARRPAAGDFADFLGGTGWLLDPRLPERHYSRDRLWGDPARKGWVPPDLIPMPG